MLLRSACAGLLGDRWREVFYYYSTPSPRTSRAVGFCTTRCLKREILSRGYNFLLRRAFPGTVVDDGQCGFKGIRVARVQPLLPQVENNVWFFDTELLILAEHQGMDVRMFPVEWVEDPQTSVRIMSAIWEDLKGIQRLRGKLRKLPRMRKASPSLAVAPTGRG